ncbi:MAG: GIY-YIG nuclease family protein [Pseudomonadota bacterium]|nr:GIY-YIG nuclease family protein [Pseudomonadota bacterium]
MSTKIVAIYKIFNKISQKCYVGSTRNLMRRITKHKNELKYGRHHAYKLQQSWDKHGEPAFEFIVLEYIENTQISQEDLFAREQFWIDSLDSYNKGYNSSPLADSMQGVQKCDIIKEKHKKGREGYKHSEKTKQKIGAAHKGRKKSPEQIEKMREANLGKKYSEETKHKQSLRRKGKLLGPKSEEHKKALSEAGFKFNENLAKEGKEHYLKSVPKSEEAKANMRGPRPHISATNSEAILKWNQERQAQGLPHPLLGRIKGSEGAKKGWATRRNNILAKKLADDAVKVAKSISHMPESYMPESYTDANMYQEIVDYVSNGATIVAQKKYEQIPVEIDFGNL